MSDVAARLRPRRWPWLVGGAVLAALIAADRNGWLLVRRPDDMAAYHGAAVPAARVIDGDTFEIEIADRMHDRPFTQVRLWGVDAPEAAAPGRAAEPGAELARMLTRSLIAGGPVILELEPHCTRGVWGRVLAHVHLPDGSSLNESLLAAGLATVDERRPHSRLTRYARAERIARQQALGLWASQREGE